ISHEIFRVDDDITQVDANPKTHAGVCGSIGAAENFERVLNVESAANRFNGTREFRNYAVACTAEYAALMLQDQAIDLAPACLQRAICSLLVTSHHAGVAGSIRRKDGRQLALRSMAFHRSPIP